MIDIDANTSRNHRQDLLSLVKNRRATENLDGNAPQRWTAQIWENVTKKGREATPRITIHYSGLKKSRCASCSIELRRQVECAAVLAEFLLESYSLGSFVGRTVLLVGRDINRDRDEHRGLAAAPGASAKGRNATQIRHKAASWNAPMPAALREAKGWGVFRHSRVISGAHLAPSSLSSIAT